MIMDLDWSYQN